MDGRCFSSSKQGTIAAVAVAFAKFLGVLAPAIATDNYLIAPIRVGGGYAISLSTEQLIAVLLIFLLSWSNTRGLELGKFVQNIFTFAKTAALIALIVIGLSLGWKPGCAALSADWWNPWANGWNPQTAQPGLTFVGALAVAVLLGKAMVGPLFAQSAWNNVTFTGSEVRDPGKNLPRALLAGCAIVVTLYVLANVAYLATLSFPEIQNAPQNRVAVAAMRAVLGAPGTIAMAVAIMISTFGCNNGLILAGSRVYYAMARDALFFRGAANTNKHHVPAVALATQGVWAAFLTLPRTVVTQSDKWRCYLRKCLHAVARIHRLRRSALLCADGWRRHRAAKKNAGGRASVSHMGLSDCADHLHYPRRALDHRSLVARADDIRHRGVDRAYRNSCLPCLEKEGGDRFLISALRFRRK